MHFARSTKLSSGKGFIKNERVNVESQQNENTMEERAFKQMWHENFIDSSWKTIQRFNLNCNQIKNSYHLKAK